MIGGLGIGAGLLGLRAAAGSPQFAKGFGPLVSDPDDILDLPRGWQYRVISRIGERMDDGLRVPGQPDGMCAFPGPKGEIVLVRNHELGLNQAAKSAFSGGGSRPSSYNREANGGTTTLFVDPKTRTVERQFLSLAGTHRNCAGGPTPWGSWISCEEDVSPGHGYPFEVRAGAPYQRVEPIKAMGRFRREAIAVHAKSSCVYQTEDRHKGLLYRYVPRVPGELSKGGKLQALTIAGRPRASTNNRDGQRFAVGETLAASWVDLDQPESPRDDLRARGHARGAAQFERGEGIWADGDAIYFCATVGGRTGNGQIWRYTCGPAEGVEGDETPTGQLSLFAEPGDSALLENGDNLTMAPWGDLLICEDGMGWNRLMGITPTGGCYPIARNETGFSEVAGVCFSPDGKTLFLNIQEVGLTVAIWGFA